MDWNSVVWAKYRDGGADRGINELVNNAISVGGLYLHSWRRCFIPVATGNAALSGIKGTLRKNRVETNIAYK